MLILSRKIFFTVVLIILHPLFFQQFYMNDTSETFFKSYWQQKLPKWPCSKCTQVDTGLNGWLFLFLSHRGSQIIASGKNVMVLPKKKEKGKGCVIVHPSGGCNHLSTTVSISSRKKMEIAPDETIWIKCVFRPEAPKHTTSQEHVWSFIHFLQGW